MQPRSQRQRVLKGGKILINDRMSVLDCMVRNLSPEGACLHIASTAGVPPAFTLVIADETERDCVKVWARAGRLGVRFV